MAISRDDLRTAVEEGLLDEQTAGRLWQRFGAPVDMPVRSSFGLTNLLWYAGALVVVLALILFSAEAFRRWGGGALFVTSVVYAAVFLGVGLRLWSGRDFKVLGGLLVTIAVTMVPAAVFGVQDYFDLWTHGRPYGYENFFRWAAGSWVFMSLATVVAGLVALRFCAFPFVTVVIAVALWFLSMDLTPWIVEALPGVEDVSRSDLFDWRGIVSTIFGLLVFLVATVMDRTGAREFAFWPHTVAAVCILGGLYPWLTDTSMEWAVIGMTGIAMLLVSVGLGRRSYAVAGAIGLASWLGYMAFDLFEDSLMFSLALALIGLGVMALGFVYVKYEARLARIMRG